METYWHRLCANLPSSLAAEGRKLAKATGHRPPINRYLRLWDLIRPYDLRAEGLALLSEGTRLWPRAISIKLELAKLYLAQGDGRRVTSLLSLAEAQKDPACGWVALKGALLCGKVQWVAILASSLAIAKLDKSAAEQQALDLCQLERWQDAETLIRRHHGLPAAEPATSLTPGRMPANAPRPKAPRPKKPTEGHPLAEAFSRCVSVDAASVPEQLQGQLLDPLLDHSREPTQPTACPPDQDSLGSGETVTRIAVVKKLLAAAAKENG